MSDTLDKAIALMRPKAKARKEARARAIYTIQLTGKQVDDFLHGVLLNRRLLDRGPDQRIVDIKISEIARIIIEHEETLPEFAEFRALRREFLDLMQQYDEIKKVKDKQ